MIVSLSVLCAEEGTAQPNVRPKVVRQKVVIMKPEPFRRPLLPPRLKLIPAPVGSPPIQTVLAYQTVGEPSETPVQPGGVILPWPAGVDDEHIDLGGVDETDEFQLEDPKSFAMYGYCTATYLGRGLFMTGGHCVSSMGTRGHRPRPCGFPIKPFEQPEIPRESCTIKAFAWDEEHDWALLEITDDQTAQLTAPAVPIDYSIDWDGTARLVRLFGYSKGQLKLNRLCLARGQVGSRTIRHQCDTDYGDSGSVLIDFLTGRIVAVHGGRLQGEAYNYAFSVSDIPWGSVDCSSMELTMPAPLTTDRPFSIDANTAPPRLRRTVVISATGEHARPQDLVFEIFGPATVPTPTALIDGRSFRFRFQAELPPSVPAGTWTLEIRNLGGEGQVSNGHVWLCD